MAEDCQRFCCIFAKWILDEVYGEIRYNFDNCKRFFDRVGCGGPHELFNFSGNSNLKFSFVW